MEASRRNVFLHWALLVCSALAGANRGIAADSLPAYCGPVGTARYEGRSIPVPVEFPEPPVILQRGTIITVTSSSDTVNGDVSTVAGLIATPGPDGISLREAITATNNNPGTYTVRFAAALRGTTVRYSSPNDPLLLLGGNVTLNGDMDGDDQPDITLDGGGQLFGLQVLSSENVLNALAIENFGIGVFFPQVQGVNQTLAGNVIRNLTIRKVNGGIGLNPGPGPLATRWVDTLVVGNTIETTSGAIGFDLHFAAGNVIERLIIRNNTIRVAANESGVALSVTTGFFAGSDGNRISDIVIADNTIEGATDYAIRVNSGSAGGQRNVAERIRVSGNRLRLSAPSGRPTAGIVAGTGDSGTEDFDPTFRPVVMSDENEMRDLWITGNSVEGPSSFGIAVGAGGGGPSRNTVQRVFIFGNTVTGVGSSTRAPTYGIYLEGGAGMNVITRAPSEHNLVYGAVVQGNTVRLNPAALTEQGGGIEVAGAIFGGVSHGVRNVWISHNDVDGGGDFEIFLLGAWSGPEEKPTGNVVSGVEVWCNTTRHRNTALPRFAKAVSLIGALYSGSNNSVEMVRLEDNLMGDVLNDYAIIPNADPGTTGNTVTLMPPPDGSTPELHPGGLRNLATLRNEPVAPGSLVSLFGWNLASELAAPSTVPLPTELAGTTVKVNGIAVPLLFLSPEQIIFQVPWELSGQPEAFVTVTWNAKESRSQPFGIAAAGPGLLAVNNSGTGQGAILVADTGQLAAPRGSHPGARPVRRGESIELYAIGLGPVANPPPSGAASGATSRLTTTPALTLGGVPTTVTSSGLSPGWVGFYQVTARVPAETPVGDAVPVSLTIGSLPSNVVTMAVE